MAELATLARPYAVALYDLATEDHEVDTWRAGLEVLAQVVDKPGVRELVESPSRSAKEKAERLYTLLEDWLPSAARNLMTVLAGVGRLGLLPEICSQFAGLQAADAQATDVTVISASELDGGQVDALRQAMQRRIRGSVEVNVETDPSLLGGALIRFGDTVLDASVRGRLERMREALSRA